MRTRISSLTIVATAFVAAFVTTIVGIPRAIALGGVAGSGGPCRPAETAVVIDARAHRLHLCAAGNVERTFVVALGRGGLGKFRTGDQKTPLGEYLLGPPRASSSYHVFIPVAYPTPIQARLGFTGTAIGVHGPPRGWRGWLASRHVAVTDWTDGCIAVGSDAEIDDISAWVKRQKARRVRLGVGA